MEKDNLFDLEVEDFTTESVDVPKDTDNILSMDVFGESSETPSSKPSDTASVPIPKSTEISVDAYNSALAALKKSFNEGAAIIEMLEKVKVVSYDIESLQDQYTESVINEAIFESYINGPYYEAADDPDKKEIKKVVSAIVKAAPRDEVDKYKLVTFKSATREAINGIKEGVIGGGIVTAIMTGLSFVFTGNTQLAKAMIKLGAVLTGARAVGRAVGGAIGSKGAKIIVRKLQSDNRFKTYLWQMVGIFYTVGDPVETALKHYTEKFKEQLGDYQLNAIKLKIECEKEAGHAYLLVVDSKKKALGTINLKLSASDFK